MILIADIANSFLKDKELRLQITEVVILSLFEVVALLLFLQSKQGWEKDFLWSQVTCEEEQDQLPDSDTYHRDLRTRYCNCHPQIGLSWLNLFTITIIDIHPALKDGDSYPRGYTVPAS